MSQSPLAVVLRHTQQLIFHPADCTAWTKCRTAAALGSVALTLAAKRERL